MTASDLKQFVRDARRATGAVLNPHISINMIVAGNDRKYYFDCRFTEKKVLRYLARKKISVHREDEMQVFVLSVYLIGFMMTLMVYACQAGIVGAACSTGLSALATCFGGSH